MPTFPVPCSNCGGRKSIPGEVECHVCFGKGQIHLTVEELRKYFLRFNKRPER